MRMGETRAAEDWAGDQDRREGDREQYAGGDGAMNIGRSRRTHTFGFYASEAV
jgi:hypothetical protein